MTFRGCLPSAVLGPVHTVGYKRDRRGIDRMNRAFEALGKFAVTTSFSKTRRLLPTVLKRFPEEFLSHGWVAGAVRMREGVATRGGGASNRGQLPCVVLQTVTDIVQAERSGRLSVD